MVSGRRSLAWASLAAAVTLALAPAAVDAQRRGGGRGGGGGGGAAAGGGTGRLIVICQQEGAQIFVDEQPVGTVPLEPQSLGPGEHTVRVTQPGYTEFTDVVTIRSRQDTQVEVELIAVSGVVRVTSVPEGAQVFVDGRFQGQTPAELELPEGEHSIRVRQQGFAEAIRTVRATPGHQAELEVRLEALAAGDDPSHVYADPKSWYERPWTWLAIGGGAVAVAVTITVIVLSTGGPSAYDQFCGTPSQCPTVYGP